MITKWLRLMTLNRLIEGVSKHKETKERQYFTCIEVTSLFGQKSWYIDQVRAYSYQTLGGYNCIPFTVLAYKNQTTTKIERLIFLKELKNDLIRNS